MRRKSTIAVAALVLLVIIAVLLRPKGDPADRPGSKAAQAGSQTASTSDTRQGEIAKGGPGPVTGPTTAPRIRLSFQALALRLLEFHRDHCDGEKGRICHRMEPYFVGQRASGRDELRL